MFRMLDEDEFDWARAIDRNSRALIAIVAQIVRMLGLDGEAGAARIAPGLQRAVLRLLMPAESACRRLIVMAAQGLVLAPRRAPPPAPQGVAPRNAGTGNSRTPIAPGRRVRQPAFRLADPRLSLSWSRPAPLPALMPGPPRDDNARVPAKPLRRRVQALKAALSDLPRQARRLMRWRARQLQAPELSLTFMDPMRPGLPPGHRRRPIHEVDHVLIECHARAQDAMRFNTS